MSRLVDQGEGWFQVKQTGRRLRFVPKPTNNDGIPSPNPVHPNPNPTLSVDELATYHELVTKDLQSSPWWQEVLQTLQSVADKSGGLPSIKKAVCLGPGPYEPRNCSSTARKTAHIQTAVFCYLVEYFEAQTGEEIQSIIQEPMFTETDKAFCATLGLKAVDSPGAFSVIDEDTMVFAIHMELGTYSQVLSTHVPALFVGSDPENWETAARVDSGIQADLEGYARIEQTHGKVVFPDLDMMFFSTVLYWRRGES